MVAAEVSQAKMYIAGQVGYAAPSDLSDIKGTGSSAGTTSTDLALKSGLAYGMKVGGDFTMAPSLNVLAGVRAFVTEHIAFFGEFKHNRSTFKFSDDEFDAKYRTNMFPGGPLFTSSKALPRRAAGA